MIFKIFTWFTWALVSTFFFCVYVVIAHKMVKITTKRILKSLSQEIKKSDIQPPYSNKDFLIAKYQGLDLNNFADYEKYFKIGEDHE